MSKSNFQQLINNSDKPVLVDFYADWCQPCQTMTPVINSIAGKLKDHLKVIKVNVDKNQNAALKFKVRSIPTFILFNQGKEVWRKGGMLTERAMKKEIEQRILNK